jgi:hypothetical protein
MDEAAPGGDKTKAKPSAEPGQRGWAERTWPFWLAFFLLAASGRVYVAASYFSPTVDEGAHIAGGLEWIQRGVYRLEEQHPPLARVAAAAGPYLAGSRIESHPRASISEAGRAVLYWGGRHKRTITLARLGILPFLIAMCLAVAVWTRRWFGAAGSIVAVALISQEPTVLAHSALATTDLGSAAMTFIAIGSLYAALSRPSLKTALAAGVCCALALLTKFSAIPFVTLSFGCLVACRTLLPPDASKGERLPRRRLALLAATAMLAGALVVWGGYRFSVGRLLFKHERPHVPLMRIADLLSVSRDRMYSLAEARVYPGGELLRGILEVKDHNRVGHRAFLLGEIRQDGWWYFFPVVLGVKTTIPFLLLGIGGLVLAAVRGYRRRDWRLCALTGCAVVILAFAMTSRINLGVRHILVLYPLLATAAAGYGPLPGKSNKALGAVVLLLCWQSVESVRAHPDYLPYFNVIAGSHPEEIRVDSDLDWGQDLDRLAEACRRLGIKRLRLAYFSGADLEWHGLPEVQPLRSGERAAGWIAISLSHLKLHPERYSWLESHEPYALVGKSIRLYRIPEERP